MSLRKSDSELLKKTVSDKPTKERKNLTPERVAALTGKAIKEGVDSLSNKDKKALERELQTRGKSLGDIDAISKVKRSPTRVQTSTVVANDSKPVNEQSNAALTASPTTTPVKSAASEQAGNAAVITEAPVNAQTVAPAKLAAPVSSAPVAAATAAKQQTPVPKKTKREMLFEVLTELTAKNTHDPIVKFHRLTDCLVINRNHSNNRWLLYNDEHNAINALIKISRHLSQGETRRDMEDAKEIYHDCFEKLNNLILSAWSPADQQQTYNKHAEELGLAMENFRKTYTDRYNRNFRINALIIAAATFLGAVAGAVAGFFAGAAIAGAGAIPGAIVGAATGAGFFGGFAAGITRKKDSELANTLTNDMGTVRFAFDNMRRS